MSRRACALVWFLAGVLTVIVFKPLLPKHTTPDPEMVQYCSLVALHRKNPDLGWPDFHNVFDAACNTDGTVKER